MHPYLNNYLLRNSLSNKVWPQWKMPVSEKPNDKWQDSLWQPTSFWRALPYTIWTPFLQQVKWVLYLVLRMKQWISRKRHPPISLGQNGKAGMMEKKARNSTRSKNEKKKSQRICLKLWLEISAPPKKEKVPHQLTHHKSYIWTSLSLRMWKTTLL